MASKGGCNDVAKPSGQNSTRINPNSFQRNNLAKGGVNQMPAAKTSTGTAKRK